MGDDDVAVRRPLVFTSLYRYERAWAGADLAAGLTLLVIAVPEQLATSRLAGMPPITGFYAFVVGTLLFALLGSNPQMSVGADSTIAPLFAAGVSALALMGSPHYVDLVGILAVMVGLMVMLVTVLRLGWIAEFLSTPIVAGFLSGVAVIIIAHQLPELLGLPPAGGSNEHRFGYVLTHLSGVNGWSLALGLGVLAVMFVSARIDRRIPGALIGMVASTALVGVLDLQAHGVAVLGTVTTGVPHFGLAGLSWSTLGSLAPLAAVVSLVVVTQTAATTRAFAEQGGYDADAGRDFFAVGAGNVAAGLVGSFPVNASPPRTGAVATAGGRTQAGPLGAAAAVVLLIPFADILKDVPLAALAAILIFVAVRLFHLRELARHRALRPLRVRPGGNHAVRRGPRRGGAGDRRRRRAGHPRPDPPECPPAGARAGSHSGHHQLGPAFGGSSRRNGARRPRPPLRHPALVCQRDRLPRGGRPRAGGCARRARARARRPRDVRHRLHRDAGAGPGDRRLRARWHRPRRGEGG